MARNLCRQAGNVNLRASPYVIDGHARLLKVCQNQTTWLKRKATYERLIDSKFPILISLLERVSRIVCAAQTSTEDPLGEDWDISYIAPSL